MKKIIGLMGILMFSACALDGSNNNSIGKSWVQSYVNNRCVSELQNRSEWRTAALLMSSETQTKWQNKICGCVSEEAINHMTTAEMPLLLTENGRAQIATEITTKTVTACVKRLFLQ